MDKLCFKVIETFITKYLWLRHLLAFCFYPIYESLSFGISWSGLFTPVLGFLQCAGLLAGAKMLRLKDRPQDSIQKDD